jgi:hypothetical protein
MSTFTVGYFVCRCTATTSTLTSRQTEFHGYITRVYTVLPRGGAG